MTLSKLARFALLTIAVAIAGPALAQYQELPVEAGVAEAASGYSWSVRVTGDGRVLAGDVPYLSVKALLISRAGGGAVDRMGIAQGAPRGFMIDATKAVEASALLSEGAVTYADGAWTVSGTLQADADRAALEAVLGERTAAGGRWQIELAESAQESAATNADAPEPEQDSADGATAEQSGEDSTAEPQSDGEISEPDEPEQEISAAIGEEAIEPIENSVPAEEAEDAVEPVSEKATSAPAEEAEGEAVAVDPASVEPAAIDICREQVATYMADRDILFGSGSARLTEDSQANITGLAEIFAICPSAPVYVEGHTDADGGAEDNLILSLSRAEAVVDALVELGIDPQRLYAVGYGASLPVASNETAAGKAQNRRIVFSFEDIAGPGEGDDN